jgi:hypothetical protein
MISQGSIISKHYIIISIYLFIYIIIIIIIFHKFWAYKSYPLKNNLVLEINKKRDVDSLVCSLAFYLVLIPTIFFHVFNTIVMVIR